MEYLKANVQPGKPVVVSELNKMFTAPDEQKVLNRLFNTFFKIPMFVVQYNTSSKKIPTLQELAEQFNFKVPGEADVMLRIMESDPRLPDSYRQECLSGEAEDLAWVVGRGGSKHLLRTLEFSPLEPSIVERKVYRPRVGVVSEQQLSGGHETLELVRVK